MNEKPRESSLSRFLQTEARALDLRAALRNLAEEAGMKFFVFGTFPDADHPGLIENTIETNWPSEMVRRYSSADLLKTSALIRKMRTTGLPVSGSLLLTSADAKAQPEPPAEFEGSFTSNLALTAFDLRGSRYVYMISGPSQGSTPEDSGRLLLDLVSTIERYCPGPIQQQSLSTREIECLKWSAAGKSSGETAMILGLSSHTIDTYLRDAMKKLDSVTRVQAVAKAIRAGLL